MAKRPTDSGPLPRRMVDAPAVSPPICGHTEDRGDRPYVCAKNPGHLGGHTMTRADGEIVRKLTERAGTPAGGFFDVLESPTDVAAMQTPTAMDHWTCAAKVRDEADGRHYICDRHDKHDPNPAAHGHHWHALADDQTAAATETLPAVSPPDDVQAAGPARPTPDAPTASEPTGESTASAAGSGGGSGRPFTGHVHAEYNVDQATCPECQRIAANQPTTVNIEQHARMHGSGGGSGRSTTSITVDGPLFEQQASDIKRAMERPGQVAAGFGTSSGDLPFQAAHLGVLIPADRPQDARALAEEAAHVGGLMRTLGQITADYHAQKRLASPGLLVGLRFQVEAMLAGRGLDQ